MFVLAMYMKLVFRDGSQQDCFKIVTQYEKIFTSAPCINSIKNTFYCSNWCTLL